MESWRPIHGYDGYEVSDHGRVKSLRGDEPVILAAGRHTKGYSTVRLSLGAKGKGTSFLVHRLVLEAFVGLRPKGHQCRHLDGDKTNNRLENLCWGTGRENHRDMARHKTALRGEKNHKTKLRLEEVAAIRERLSVGTETVSNLAAEFGVSPTTISSIKNGVTWRDDTSLTTEKREERVGFALGRGQMPNRPVDLQIRGRVFSAGIARVSSTGGHARCDACRKLIRSGQWRYAAGDARLHELCARKLVGSV